MARRPNYGVEKRQKEMKKQKKKEEKDEKKRLKREAALEGDRPAEAEYDDDDEPGTEDAETDSDAEE